MAQNLTSHYKNQIMSASQVAAALREEMWC